LKVRIWCITLILNHRVSTREAVKAIVELLSALEAIHPQVDRIQELRDRMEEGDITGEEYNEFLELRSSGFLHRDIKLLTSSFHQMA